MNGRHILITGAGGFVGQRLARALLSQPDFAAARLTLTDVSIAEAPPGNVQVFEGDLCDGNFLADILATRADTVFHLAGLLGGAAEADYDRSRRVNLDASLRLLEALRDETNPSRVVFASSIAVFGPPLPPFIDDDTMPVPMMHYGGQKRMIEVALEQFTAHGWIDGIALRLPGIVARRGADSRLKSAFLSTIFHDYAAGNDFSVPVSPEGTVWLISATACVEAFIHAARLPAERLGPRRAVLLPAQRMSLAELLAALRERYPDSASKVFWDPDPGLESQFARQPPLSTAMADALGFRHDGTLANLITRALQ